MRSQEPNLSDLPVYVCDNCGGFITASELDESHTHHDGMTCDWAPDSDIEYELLFHELVCLHQVHYHMRCCRKCSVQYAGV